MELTDLEELLSTTLKAPARIAVIGVGNSLRSDDFVGIAIVQQLKAKIQRDLVLLIEADTSPTDFFHVIQEWNPSHLLIIDAADFKKPPGSVNVIKREQMTEFTLSSHKRALILLVDFLTHYLPELKIIIIGIQPASVEFNVDINLSPIIQSVIEKFVNLLVPILSNI